MRISLILCICSFCFLSKTYTQEVLSLHPLFVEQDAVLIPGIEGAWCIEGLDTISIQKAGDNFYRVTYGNNASPSIFEAIFLRIRNEVYLDLNGVVERDALEDDFYSNKFLSLHSFFKIKMHRDTLQLIEPNYSWFYNYAKQDESPLKYEWIKSGMLLTYKTGELRLFLAQHGKDKELFANTTSFTHIPTNHNKKETVIRDVSSTNTSNPISQACLPAFPFKDGWVGGDGDVSVPINAISTLFIFSDSWIGTKHQQSRMEPGMNMVSNSVAVETCLPNGATDVKYYWNNKYADYPTPIFESFTRRYNYWVPQAFMINGILYVVLEKVGPRLGASSKEVFNFSLLGYTLAKISNPEAAPDKWLIEYNPLPEFGNPSMSIGAHAILGDHIYFFVSRHDKAQVLVRKRLEFFDDPQKPFEYFALNKKWKEGLNMHDMDTLIHGFRTTTVNFHPEMNEWVMISDIRFMDNKIKMRTAPALTGPWSDEIDIYEIPEVTAGNPSYTESNFCYLPRECIQNYDTARHQMILTYDINNPDFSKINANPAIYTPKVISIQLKESGKQ